MSFSLFSQSRIERIAPPNWWTGMVDPVVQITLYGEKLARLQPQYDYPGVETSLVHSVENPNYLFIYLEISEDAQAGTMKVSLLDEDNNEAGSFDFELREREKGSAGRKGFGPEDVMYLITPDRFANGDPSNDNIKGMKEKADRGNLGGRHGGDLEGISNMLDYIAGMGFTAIWLNPVVENDMPAYSYHGYAATDFYKVDKRFGTNEQYRELCSSAREKGIKVIMDMIMNHCGSEHWFVLDPPTTDWINFGGEYVNTSHRRNTVQDIHASEYDKKHFSDGWFVSTMPDMNQRNPLMADYLITNTIWWIEFAGLDGIRMDTYPYPDKEFMTDWTCRVMQEYPDFNIVGEEWVTNPAIVSYWQAGKQNHDGYVSCLPSLMDFPIQHALAEALNGEERQYGSGLIRLYETLALDFLYPDPYNLVTFPDNHDMARFYTQVNEDNELFKMGLAYIATMRGIPQFYYGTEILMNSRENPGDHGLIRSDFPGGWKGDTVNAVNGQGLSPEQKEAQFFMQKLLNWRKSSAAVHSGKLMQFAPEDGIYVFFRYTGKDKVMVVMNKNAQGKSLDLERFAEMLDTHSSASDVMTGESFSLEKKLSIPAKTAMILEIE